MVGTTGTRSRNLIKTKVLSGVRLLVIRKNEPVHYNERAEFVGWRIRMSRPFRHPLERATLAQRFMLASLIILIAGMTGIGIWIGNEIKNGVIHRTGATTALYVDSFVAPHLQELGTTGTLSPESHQKLSKLLQDTP